MRSFEHIAKLIRTKRMNHPKGYSQSDLSHLLGYKNGQFISNVERGLCSIPLKMLGRVSEILDIPKSELKDAVLNDHASSLDFHLNTTSATGDQRINRNRVESGMGNFKVVSGQD
jgi:transcriptional regulator with XRE-family HTH domain